MARITKRESALYIQVMAQTYDAYEACTGCTGFSFIPKK